MLKRPFQFLLAVFFITRIFILFKNFQTINLCLLFKFPLKIFFFKPATNYFYYPLIFPLIYALRCKSWCEGSFYLRAKASNLFIVRAKIEEVVILFLVPLGTIGGQKIMKEARCVPIGTLVLLNKHFLPHHPLPHGTKRIKMN